MGTKTKFFSKKVIAVLIGLSLVSAACGKDPAPAARCGGSATLTFWKTFEDGENLQPIFEEYRRICPNVQIVYTKKNIENYESDLIKALASNTGPDIFSINNSWLPSYMDVVTSAPDSILNFTEYKNAFVDVAVSDFTKNGKVYGVPMVVDSMALYYNKDILGSAGIATPPKTWEELASQVRRIRKQDRFGYFTTSGVAMGTNTNVNRSVDILYLLMLQRGVVPYNEDRTSPAFAQSVLKDGNQTNPGREGLDFYTSFASPFSPNYNWNYRSDYSIDAFVNGRAAFLYSYAYTRQTIVQKSPNLNFDVTLVPQFNLDQPSVNFANYWGEVVSKQSRNPAAAWYFLKFLTSKETLDKYYSRHKQPSSRRDLIELQISDPEIGVFSHANLTAKQFYRPDQGKIDNIFGSMIDNVILNGVSVDEALSRASQQASAVRLRDLDY